MERIESLGSSLRIPRGSVREILGAQASTDDRKGRGGGRTAGSSGRGEAFEPFESGSHRETDSAGQRAALLEEFRAEGLRQGKSQAERAAKPSPQPKPADAERMNRQRSLESSLVATLAQHKPPAEGRRLAAVQSRAMRESRNAQVGEVIERVKDQRTVHQDRAASAYRETAGLFSDSSM